MALLNGRYFHIDCARSIIVDFAERGGEYLNVAEEDTATDTTEEPLPEEETFVCERCGAVHKKSSSTKVQVDWHCYELWCDDCAEEHTFVCEECGDVTSEDYSTYVESEGSIVCNDCLENEFHECDCCGEYVRDVNRTANGDYVCEQCLDDYYHCCSECGEYVPNDDFNYDAGMCNECAANLGHDDRRILDYSAHVPIHFYGDAPKFIGLELEADPDDEDYNQTDAINRICQIAPNRFYFKEDGSLRDGGFETIIQPHSESEFRALDWSAILSALRDNGFYSHEGGTCGLHMHFSREWFGDDEEEQGDNIAKLMQFYELYWEDVLKASRRTEEQANNWAKRYGIISKSRLKEIEKSTRKCGDHWRRYAAINNTNANTVELRLTRGTLNESSFLACCDFMITLVKNSSRIDWGSVSEDYEWLKGISSNTVEYLGKHHAFSDSLSTLFNEAREREANGQQ